MIEKTDSSDSRADSSTSLQAAAFVVPTMHCASCIRTLENGLSRLKEVDQVRANLSTRQVEVIWTGGESVLKKIGKRISNLGFENHIVDSSASANEKLRRQGRHLLLCLAVAGFASANIMLLSVSVWSGADAETAKLFALISGLIAVPAVFFAGSPFFSSALKALVVRQLNMDVPISLAVLLSLFMSLYEALIGGGEIFFDAAVMLLFFLLIGRTLDHFMREKAASGVRGLARLIPRTVSRLEDDGSTTKINLSDIESGMHLRLLPGDRFPVDARVVRGSSAADRSIVTGEAEDVPIRAGDAFEAGTLNIASPIDVKAVSDARTSFLAEVIEMMKAAETSKGRYRRIADRMAAVYAPAVHLLALITFTSWVLLTGEFKPSFVSAIAVLIITCPCALGLAVPVTHVVAANRLFKEGILMRDGSALERLAEADTVFFDKTGTLTSDELRLADIPRLEEDHAEVLQALAEKSQHPVARAIAKEYSGSSIEKLSGVTEIAGFGIQALWRQKRTRLGRVDWVSELGGVDIGPEEGSTAFAIENHASYNFSLKSDLKPDATEAVKQIHSQGYAAAILSGDRRDNVEDVARCTGIESWCFGLTPQAKIDRIQDCKDTRKVLMVGDGLNDAPSLAAAHASMAPASATDVSRASADFVFTRPSLLAVPVAMRLSVAANRIVRQNFAIAIIYNCIAVPLAVAGHVTPLLAAIAMSLSSIIVVSNSMRLAAFDRIKPAGGSKTEVMETQSPLALTISGVRP
ncbi:MAG: heavy metal translocating P-type ATPase [Rhizobiaceae bacterium]